MNFAWCSIFFSPERKGLVVIGKMTLSDDEITRLYRIRKTVMQMLRDRGYLVGDFEINMTRYQFVDKFGDNMKREDLVINKAKRNDSSDQVCGLQLPNFFMGT